MKKPKKKSSKPQDIGELSELLIMSDEELNHITLSALKLEQDERRTKHLRAEHKKDAEEALKQVSLGEIMEKGRQRVEENKPDRLLSRIKTPFFKKT